MTQDSVPSGAPSGDEDSNLDPLFGASGDVREGGIGAEQSDEITSLLLKHEKRSGAGQPFIPGNCSGVMSYSHSLSQMRCGKIVTE